MNNRRLTAHLLLTIAYVVSGKLGLMLALAPGYASPIFPPAGIAVAAVFIGGRRTLPWIFLGSLLLNIWVDYAAHHQINAIGFAAASAIAAASMLQAAFGGWVLRRVVGYPASLDRGHDIMYFLMSAPAICLTSATLSVSALTALGIVGAASFAVNWAAWWVGDTLGVVVMLPLVMIAAGEPRALWQSRVRTIAAPILLIFALFVVIFLRINQWEYNDSLSEFRQASQQAVNRVQTQLEGHESLLEQTAGLFIHDANGRITREEFHRFTERPLIRFPAIQALEWALRVDAAHRASFEAAQRKDFPGFEIRERNAAGQLQRAGERAQFYPVTYVEPLAGNEPALGFDLASTPDRHAALAEAVKRGVAVATPPLRLVQEHQEQAGMLLLLAVNNGSNGSGVALTVLRMGDFMDKLLLDMRPMLYARLIDLDEQKTLYDSFAPGSQQALYERTFNFGTRHYRLQTAPTPAYFMQHHGWQSWSVLAAGLLGTGLFGALLLLGTGYTARIEAEVKNRTRELKESESRFRNILEHAPIGMGIAALDGRFMQINKAFCAIVGYGKDELKKMTIREITHPEDLPLDLANKQRLIGGEISSYQMDKRYIRKDGQTVWVQVTASIERDASGMPLYLIGQVEDITERRQGEEALRASENRYRLLVETSPFCIHEIDLEGRLLSMNRAGLGMLGLDDAEEICGTPYLGMVCQQDAGRVGALLRDAITDGIPSHFKFAAAGDAPLHFKSCFIPIKDDSGKVLKLMGITEDITEHKLAEEKLLESKANLRAILDNSPYIAWLKDTAGRYIAVNETFFKMTGQERIQGVLGKTDFDLWPHELAEKYRADDAGVMATHQKILTEEPSIMEGGEMHWVETFKTPVIDENGNVLGTTGFARDITERKEFEEELKRSNAELEQFSYAISHDMRQPLRMISSYLQLIEIGLSDQLDGEKRSYFNFAIEGAKRIDQMLVALLEYSRVGRVGEPPARIESRAVLDEALQFLQPALDEAHARLSIAGEWPHIFASHDEMLRLFQNLIGNAAKFRVAGRVPEITVSSEVVRSEWYLCVADNGVGIIPDQIKRLFHVFQRLQLRTAYEGNGVGLALCRKIAEHHKGRIWAESAGEGKGSRFCVVLPALKEGK